MFNTNKIMSHINFLMRDISFAICFIILREYILVLRKIFDNVGR